MTELPTLYDFAGGADAIRRLAECQYARCRRDPVLQPLFGTEPRPGHAEHLADWMAEVLGGPKTYTEQHGGFPTLLHHHQNLSITDEQREHFVDAFMSAADDADLPADTAFRSRLRDYVAWGAGVAQRNSQPGYEADMTATVPSWDWGDLRPGA
jgi:hemoglobin